MPLPRGLESIPFLDQSSSDRVTLRAPPSIVTRGSSALITWKADAAVDAEPDGGADLWSVAAGATGEAAAGE